MHEKMFFLVPTIILNRSWGVWSVAVAWLSAGLASYHAEAHGFKSYRILQETRTLSML